MGSVHNLWRFAFTCWPESRNAGKFVYIVDESNTIYRSATTSAIAPANVSPPGLAGSPYNTFPSSSDLKSFWSKLD